jgi:hypothetical protein
MRKQLAGDEGERKRYSAVFNRIGKKTNFKGYSEETILLQNIVDLTTGKRVADHLWFSYTKSFQQVDLTEGVTIEFVARVKEYTKGYVNRRYKIDQRKKDFKLSHPTQVKLMAQ